MATVKNTWSTGDNVGASDLNALATAAVPQFGTYAARPAAGNQGVTYYCTDCDSVYYDNGSTWSRVSIGGTVGPFGDVPTTGWSAVNAGSSTFAADKDSMLLTRPNSAGTDLNLYVRTLTPSSNYSAAFYLDLVGHPNGVYDLGICLRNSSSGYIICWGVSSVPASYAYGGTIRTSKWTSASAWSAAYSANFRAFASGPCPKWWRFVDNGTTRYMEYSHSGIDWLTYYSVSRTDFMTPDQIGVYAFNQSTGTNTVLRLRSWSGVA